MFETKLVFVDLSSLMPTSVNFFFFFFLHNPDSLWDWHCPFNKVFSQFYFDGHNSQMPDDTKLWKVMIWCAYHTFPTRFWWSMISDKIRGFLLVFIQNISKTSRNVITWNLETPKCLTLKYPAQIKNIVWLFNLSVLKLTNFVWKAW